MKKQKGFTLISKACKGFTLISKACKGFTLISKACKGFTLIEMLMVVFLFGLVMTLSGALFSSVLKGSGKSEVNKEVKQSGDYAMGMMERFIRNAKTVNCPTSPGSSIIVTDKDGLQTTFLCLLDSGVAGIASKSGTLAPNRITGNNVTLGSACSGDLTFTCVSTVIPPQVTISFTLKQKEVSARPEDQASVKFQSTVSLRTY
jgi:prepilin-type N-terminal cleavage/methylation domain-containing protein